VFTTTLAAIKTLPAQTCTQVLQRVEWLWDERPAVDDYEGDDAALDAAADAFERRFHQFLAEVWQLQPARTPN
jgi:hypothetical protein